MIDLFERVGFLRRWNEGAATPPVFWVSGFFFPQAFFTGVMQNFARKSSLPIDSLSFGMSLLDEIVDPRKELIRPSDDGAYVYGIFLEGCRYCRGTHQLEESFAKELFTELPPFH